MVWTCFTFEYSTSAEYLAGCVLSCIFWQRPHFAAEAVSLICPGVGQKVHLLQGTRSFAPCTIMDSSRFILLPFSITVYKRYHIERFFVGKLSIQDHVHATPEVFRRKISMYILLTSALPLSRGSTQWGLIAVTGA